jgi:hypothetical protein
MKRLVAGALAVLGGVCTAKGQEAAPNAMGGMGNAMPNFAATSAAKVELVEPLHRIGTLSRSAALPASATEVQGLVMALAAPLGTAEPPAPAPEPKFLYGGRDDYRWQLGLGLTWMRFRSSIFDASALGIKTSITYYTNDWFGIEGNITAAYAPQIFQAEHVKMAIFGGGPKIAWRQRRWEPWLHGIVGMIHEQPRTAGNSRNGLAIQAGGGADYRFNPRLSARLEGDWVQTSLFGQTQNNFQFVGGFVLHF